MDLHRLNEFLAANPHVPKPVLGREQQVLQGLLLCTLNTAVVEPLSNPADERCEGRLDMMGGGKVCEGHFGISI